MPCITQKNPTKVGFHPCNETKHVFFIFKVFHSSSPSHLWVPFCSRFCVDALRTKRGWSSPWWSFLELWNWSYEKQCHCGGPDTPWGYANFRDSRDFSEGDRSVQKSFYATKALGNKTFELWFDFWIVTIENVSLICWSNFRGFYCLKWVEAKRCIKCLGQCFVDFSSMDVDKLTNPKVQVARLKVTRWAS